MNEISIKTPSTIEEYISQTICEIDSTIAERKIKVPKGFALANGLQSAMLAIQGAKDSNGKPALQVCKKESIQKFLLEVAQNGLYANKTHYYPVVFGDQLVLLTSYLGEIYKAKRNNTDIKDIYAEVVYAKDSFKYCIKQGHKIVTLHEQELENINPLQIKACYATVTFKDGSEMSEVMTFDQVKKSWSFGQTKGESKAHKLAPDEMCKKTVMRRLAKLINATENDSLYYEEQVEDIETEIDSKQNSAYIDVTPDDFDNGVGVDTVCDDGDTDADNRADELSDEGMVEMDDPFGDLV